MCKLENTLNRCTLGDNIVRFLSLGVHPIRLKTVKVLSLVRDLLSHLPLSATYGNY